MIRLIVLFLIVTAVTPLAMNTILPEAQKAALKTWLVSNEMTFVAGVLFGDKEVPDASNPSDFLGALTSLDYTEGWNKLKNTLSNAGEEATPSLDGVRNIDPKGAMDKIQSWGAGAKGKTQDSFPSNSWFSEPLFEEETQVHSVYGSGCATSGKNVSFNNSNCQ